MPSAPLADGGTAGWQLVGQVDWDELEAIKVLSAQLQDGRIFALAAVRPVGADGHEGEAITGVMRQRGRPAGLRGAAALRAVRRGWFPGADRPRALSGGSAPHRAGRRRRDREARPRSRAASGTCGPGSTSASTEPPAPASTKSSPGRSPADGDPGGDLRLRRRADDAAARLVHGLPGRKRDFGGVARQGDAADPRPRRDPSPVRARDRAHLGARLPRRRQRRARDRTRPPA